MPAIPSHNTDVADYPWDGPATEATLPNDAGADVFRREYAWVDPDADADTKVAYKFPHHTVEDGKPGAADAAACRAILQRVGQADIPSADDDGVRAHAQHHLDAFEAQARSDEPVATTELTVGPDDVAVEVRDAAKREMDVRLLPWDKEVETLQGREVFRRGAFDGTDPAKVYLYGPNHEAKLGLGQDMKPTVVRVPTGKGIAYRDEPDGPHMTFRVARTQAGDEQLALAADGIASGISIEFAELPGGTRISTSGGRRLRNHERSLLRAATTTHRPTYGEQAAVLSIRSQQPEEAPTVAEAPAQAPAPEPFDPGVLVTQLREAFAGQIKDFEGRFGERLEKMEERSRQAIEIPAAQPEKAQARVGDWMAAVVRILTGERMSDNQLRDLQDVITTDNIGVVPDTFSTELIGIISAVRPFMESTRHLPTPATGMGLHLPKLVTRPTVATQANEKDDVDSTPTNITTADFSAVTKAGGGDLSLQILKRSSPEFLGLYLQLLAEAYAMETEAECVANLLADGGVNGGGTIDPTNLALSDAFSNAFAAIKRGPDTLWLGPSAYGAFLDANYSIGGAAIPLYPGLTPTASTGGGPAGQIRGLRAVVVPALEGSGSDAVIGPSTGFAWAEDGTYTLQVDVPGKAGRDVAIVGMIWPATLYGAAFTEYSLS